jgi:NAD(P)H-flavin reductase
MPVEIFTATLAEKQIVGEKFLYLFFELNEPHRISFTAGQYILLDVPGSAQKRSYSIASAPIENHKIELLIDITPHGAGTQYLKTLEPGGQIQFRAPMGVFTLSQPDTEIGKEEESLFFIGTGSGITSLRSMILDQLQTRNDKRKMILHWGLRNEEQLFWEEDFQLLSETFPNFAFHPVLSKASESWPFCRGRVTDCLTIHQQGERAGYYLCGSRAMINDVQALLLKKGIQQQHIHYEQYY